MIKVNECCPKFNPTSWEDKIFKWDNKRFIKDKVCSFFNIPLNFGSVIKKMMEKINKAQAQSPGWMGLSDHTSKWNMDLYVAVDQEIPEAENVSMSGRFLSKVYEGSYKNTGKWCKDFKNFTDDKGYEVKKMYMWYTTCPKCIKKYGKNYVVIIGKL